MKVTATRRAVLDMLASGVRLEVQLLGQYRDVQLMRREGLVTKVPHPTVKHGGYPADAYELTDAGRALQRSEPESLKRKRAPRSPSNDWAERAACSVLSDLCERGLCDKSVAEQEAGAYLVKALAILIRQARPR